MPIPFPGMNPYLEHPDLWPTVHRRFIKSLADHLNRHLSPIYQVKICERRYQVSGEDSLVVGSPGFSWRTDSDINDERSASVLSPDQSPNLSPESSQSDRNATPVEPRPDIRNESVAFSSPIRQATPLHARSFTSGPVPIPSEQASPQTPLPSRQKRPISVLVPVPQKIYETYLEIVDTAGEVVTIVEALSPKKKRPGRGRSLYERQRETIFGSASHFVEIDLLRGWDPSFIYGPDEAGDYRILISRSEQRPRAQLYTWNVTEPIPDISLPLSGQDELPLSLKPIVDEACDRTDLLVNYQQSPLPPLRFEETLWLENFLQAVGMRPYAS